MNDLINMLQTLALCLMLILVIFVLGWTVYAFRKFVVLFNLLIEELERPRVCVHAPSTVTTASATGAASKLNVPAEPVETEPVAEVKRYPCHRCKARLPEEPTHSRIENDKTILVFKCKRCSKETEIDPLTAVPITGCK